MKNYIWVIFTGLITFLLMYYLKLDTMTFLIVLVPVLIIMFTYGSFVYSFRDSLKMEAIPSNGYQDRVERLEREKAELNRLGFDKFGEFYLKTIPDSVTYLFKHQTEHVFFLIYHFGPKVGYDFVSHFQSDMTLTTSSTVDGGMTPRPEKNMLQIFENTSYQRSFDKHLQGCKLIQTNGYSFVDLKTEYYPQLILKSLHELAAYVRKIPFWPVLLVFWTITKRGSRYLKTIEEQVREGAIKIIR